MLTKDIFKTGRTAVSFEFFPPKTPGGWNRLKQTISELSVLSPAYVSVTYGAGGGTREKTNELIVRLQKENRMNVVAHLTCVGHTEEEIETILCRYGENGIRNILALRGDERREGENNDAGDFSHASDLVQFIRKRHPKMSVGVAGFPEGHPESLNRLEEIRLLKAKVDSGADYIVTQMFFDNRDYYDFSDRCALEGIRVPIVAGIMPVTNRKNLNRMAELSPRTRFPAGLLRAVERAETEDGVEKAGIHWASEQIRGLLDRNVPGIHIYTLNKSTAVLRMGESLGLNQFDRLL